jgi:hypothetical protein
MKNKFQFHFLFVFIFYIPTFNSTGQTIFFGAVSSPQNQYNSVGSALPPVINSEPNSVDLSIDMPPVQNQGQENSCVAFALAYACKSYQEKTNYNYSYYSNSHFDYSKVFSPAFLYNSINHHADQGCNFLEACSFLQTTGVCKWSSMPYVAGDYTNSPQLNQTNEANAYKIETYRRFENDQNLTTNLKSQLIAKNPVVVSAKSDVSYFNGGSNYSGIQPYIWSFCSNYNPNMSHAITIVGYDNNFQAFKFLNSYGESWGNNGYGWISYSNINTVINEAYIIKSKTSNNNVINNTVFQPVNQLTTNDINQGHLNFQILNVSFANPSPNPLFSSMNVTGDLSLPQGIGINSQIVVYVSFDNGSGYPGPPVMSTNWAFRLLNGQVAASTFVTPLNPYSNFYSTWSLTIPCSTLALMSGTYQPTPNGPQYFPFTSYLIAQPVLFVDNFPLKIGNPIQFHVTK